MIINLQDNNLIVMYLQIFLKEYFGLTLKKKNLTTKARLPEYERYEVSMNDPLQVTGYYTTQTYASLALYMAFNYPNEGYPQRYSRNLDDPSSWDVEDYIYDPDKEGSINELKTIILDNISNSPYYKTTVHVPERVLSYILGEVVTPKSSRDEIFRAQKLMYPSVLRRERAGLYDEEMEEDVRRYQDQYLKDHSFITYEDAPNLISSINKEETSDNRNGIRWVINSAEKLQIVATKVPDQPPRDKESVFVLIDKMQLLGHSYKLRCTPSQEIVDWTNPDNNSCYTRITVIDNETGQESPNKFYDLGRGVTLNYRSSGPTDFDEGDWIRIELVVPQKSIADLMIFNPYLYTPVDMTSQFKYQESLAVPSCLFTDNPKLLSYLNNGIDSSREYITDKGLSSSKTVWFRYDFSSRLVVNEISIKWFDNGKDIKPPEDITISYSTDGTVFKEVVYDGDYKFTGNQFNTYSFLEESLLSIMITIEKESADQYLGINEWKVYGRSDDHQDYELETYQTQLTDTFSKFKVTGYIDPWTEVVIKGGVDSNERNFV